MSLRTAMGSLLAAAGLASCGGPPVAPFDLDDPGICASAPSPAIALLCVLDEAAAMVEREGAEAAMARCASLDPSWLGGAVPRFDPDRWRDECGFRVAEAQALQGDLIGALTSCQSSGALQRWCQGHAAWLSSAGLVEAAPGDAAAQQVVDDLLERLTLAEPVQGAACPRSDQDCSVLPIVRAAAWLGIYAGSGRADPSAARGASDADGPFARGAFAWEAVRLLGPAMESGDLAASVQAIYDLERPPPAGQPLEQRCWAHRVAPRRSVLAPSYGGYVRSYVGGLRFVSQQASDDLLIATLESRWSQGADPEPAFLLALLFHPSQALRKTAAQQLALVVDDAAELEQIIVGADAEVRAVAVDVFEGRTSPARTPLAVSVDRGGCP
jgi:hypothetical protein